MRVSNVYTATRLKKVPAPLSSDFYDRPPTEANIHEYDSPNSTNEASHTT